MKLELIKPKWHLSFLILLIFAMNVKAQHPLLNNRDTLEVKEWLFYKGKLNGAQNENIETNDWLPIEVPHTFSMDAIEDIGYYRGDSWYRSTVNIPKNMKGKRIFIRFEGVGQEAEVSLNEKKIGKHIGGYSAFCFEITDHVVFDAPNVLAVKVNNSPNFKRIPVDDALFNAYGGIYRPVHIFATAEININPLFYASSGLFIEVKNVDEREAKIEVRMHISNTLEDRSAIVQLKVKDSDGNLVVDQKKKIDMSKGESVMTEELTLNKPILWQARKNPHLYKIEAEIISGGESDKVTENFGIRTYDFDVDQGFILNNEPYRLYGVCRHQEWKQSGPALSNTQHRADMDLIEEMGSTALRLAHYQQSDIMYQLADEKGILVWAEIPYVHDYSGREGDNAKQQLAELILQNYNHPSIFVWGLWNEVRAWESPDEPCVTHTKELNILAHQLDKTRPTTSASDRDMVSNMGGITDLQAWNKYFGWYYGAYEDMGTWLDQSHKEFPEIEIGISEYGVGGNIFHQELSKLEKPNGNYFPEMEQTKYHETTWEILEKRPFVWGTFIWNMFDFSVAGWNRGGIRSLNHKGLVTFDRKIKKDAFYFYKANWSEEPILYISERRHDIRHTREVEVKVYSNLEEVVLVLNGKRLGKMKPGEKNKIAVFKNVYLENGFNKIMVHSTSKKRPLKDEIVWRYEEKM